MNANFAVIGSTRLGIKPESIVPEEDTLYVVLCGLALIKDRDVRFKTGTDRIFWIAFICTRFRS